MALGNNINNGVYDSCTNTILPSRIPVILFYFILLQLSDSCNKITETTTVDGQLSVILFYCKWQAALPLALRIVFSNSTVISS